MTSASVFFSYLIPWLILVGILRQTTAYDIAKKLSGRSFALRINAASCLASLHLLGYKRKKNNYNSVLFAFKEITEMHTTFFSVCIQN